MPTLTTRQNTQNATQLDKWQREVLEEDGNISIRAGRQVGKSTVISQKAHKFSKDHPGTMTLIIAASQRQANYLFEKVKGNFHQEDENNISKAVLEFQKEEGRFPSKTELQEIQLKNSVYEEPPTMTKIVLKTGSRIYCLPAGKTGIYVRGLTIDLLIADEAAYIPEVVWNSILPMIAVSRKLRGLGVIILLSTPFGKGGFFYETFTDPDFKTWHVSSESCPRIDKLFLAKEKKRMTKTEYAQEYLGEFVDEWNQFFSTELIKRCMTFIEWNLEENYDISKTYYLGVDIARYGEDENAFVVAEMDHKRRVRIVKALTTNRMAITDTIGRILDLDKKFKFKRIFIDDAGIGGGPTDVLIEKLGRKVIGINNAKRSVDKTDRKKAIMKEDLYSNTLLLMESNLLEIISDLGLLRSLKSIIYEYTAEKNVKIYGDYTHMTEAMVRACWCVRDKGLNIWIA